MTMTKVIDRPKTEHIARPSRRWRNWWKAEIDLLGSPRRWRGGIVPAGTIYKGECEWPTKEVAEQRALDDIRVNGRQGNVYLGAHPVEGEP
jgi:hypothetical protein